MKKVLLGLVLVFGLISCESEPIEVVTQQHYDSDNVLTEEEKEYYNEVQHYFDENGNPLDQKELHDKIVRSYNKGQLYSYREARKEAIELIKYFESFEPTRYKCPSGKVTLGYGLTGKYLKGRKSITKPQAEQELKLIYDEIYSNIENQLGRRLEEHKMASLVSFAFNLGEDGLYSSTLFNMLKNGNTNVATEFSKFVYARNPKTKQMVKLRGLELRRESEKNLFNI